MLLKPNWKEIGQGPKDEHRVISMLGEELYIKDASTTDPQIWEDFDLAHLASANWPIGRIA